MVRFVELPGSESNGGSRWKDRKEEVFQVGTKTQGCQHPMCKRWKALTPGLFLHSVNEYGLNTYCVPHRAGDAGLWQWTRAWRLMVSMTKRLQKCHKKERKHRAWACVRDISLRSGGRDRSLSWVGEREVLAEGGRCAKIRRDGRAGQGGRALQARRESLD